MGEWRSGPGPGHDDRVTDRDDTGMAEDSGDLGRRVAHRRQELGLELDEVARRAGMAPAYLRYVEHSAHARPGPAACARLAAVLGTTVAWLRGGGTERPPGSGPDPGGVPELEVLDEAACWRHLDTRGVGRVVFDEEEGPVALPVNYVVQDRTVAFRTSATGPIARAAAAGRPLALEVDHLDEVRGEGWSVLVRGAAASVEDPARLAAFEGLGLQPWAGGDRHQVIALEVREVSGREIHRS
jgi:transcriptional regulator with XRE-family HTH domain